MEENKIGTTLHTIGVLTILLGIIGSFICGGIFPSISYDYSYYSGYTIEETYNFALAIIGSVASFISGMCFIGFSEIISLLQTNVDNQKIIIKNLKATPIATSEEKANSNQ